MDSLKQGSVETRSQSVTLPELLAPAGDWECAKAAVENGADAIYFGLDRFNARMRANNFTEANLPALMEFLHRRGVKGYVTFNTLIFANELADAEQYLRVLITSGVDALLVQDVGICRLIRKLSPDLPIHASTQMTVTGAAGVEFARELGCCRVVLARECGVKEISQIPKAECRLETFVHGALCVAYSGQCLTSEALGGRSANRGECAQACRMPYDLFSDGQPVPLGDRRYLLSPQDLAGLEVIPDLIRAGVSSLKIEGRLKSPEYVANITRVYRQALDKLGAAAAPDEATLVKSICAESRYDLEMGFSRGLYTGWLRGVNNQQLVHGRFGKKRGVYLGEVRRVDRESVYLNLQAELKPGDGVVFDAGHPDQKEEGGRIYSIKVAGKTRDGAPEAALFFGHGDIDFARVHSGDKVWKTSDMELERRLRQSFAGDLPRFQRPLALEVYGQVGKPMTLVARDAAGHVVRVDSEMPLVEAQKQPLSEQRLREQLGRLGGTPFQLGALKNSLEGQVMLPMSELNRVRREAVEKLEVLRAQPQRWQLNDFKLELPIIKAESTPGAEAKLIVLVRSLEQLETVLHSGVELIYCEFEDPKKYREAVARVVEFRAGSTAPQIFVAPPRIFKAGEEWVLKQVRSSNADGYLVRNYDHLKFFAGEKMVGDFSLNVANSLTAEYFRERFGLERLTASYDLNITQLEALLRTAPAQWFEVTIHQHMPMFHMEHCVFCAFLSKGTDYTNCGRPCDKHVVNLRDRVGLQNPIKADAGCRNTVFNGRAQTGAEYVTHMLAWGVQHFRIEFVNETSAEVAKTVSKYRALLRGEVTGPEVWRELKLWNQLGVTRGQMSK